MPAGAPPLTEIRDKCHEASEGDTGRGVRDSRPLPQVAFVTQLHCGHAMSPDHQVFFKKSEIC